MNPLDRLEPDVRSAVEEVLVLGPRATACFDADGTIWRGDIGEDFLRQLIAQKRLIDPPAGDLYAEYERMVPLDAVRAFSLCVVWMRGLSQRDLLTWSLFMYRERFPQQLFPGMVAILDAFNAAGVRILVVSASNAITVRAAVPELGIDPANVLAVEGELDRRGCLTGRVVPPVTCSGGKVLAIEKVMGKGRPAIAFGNSLFDREMLEHAERAVLVAPVGLENAAVKLAREQKWGLHRGDASLASALTGVS